MGTGCRLQFWPSRDVLKQKDNNEEKIETSNYDHRYFLKEEGVRVQRSR